MTDEQEAIETKEQEDRLTPVILIPDKEGHPDHPDPPLSQDDPGPTQPDLQPGPVEGPSIALGGGGDDQSRDKVELVQLS